MIFILLAILVAAIGFYYSAAILASLVVAATFIFNLSWLRWVLDNPWAFAGYVASYLLIGAGWSIIKWYLTETNRVREAKIAFDRFDRKQTWEEFVQERKTDPSNHAGDIKTWVAFWPVNILYTLLNDTVRRMTRRIVTELRAVYQRITDAAWT